MRIELTHKGFADLSLTTWVPRPNVYRTAFCPQKPEFPSHPDSIGRRRFYRPRKIRVSSGSYQGTTLHAAEKLVARSRSGSAGLQASVPGSPHACQPDRGICGSSRAQRRHHPRHSLFRPAFKPFIFCLSRLQPATETGAKSFSEAGLTVRVRADGERSLESVTEHLLNSRKLGQRLQFLRLLDVFARTTQLSGCEAA